MGRRRIDLTGQVFGRLTVLRLATPEESHDQLHSFFLCRCENDGNEVIVRSDLLRSGITRSCGCLREENDQNYIHGLSYSREYLTWKSMRERCGVTSPSPKPQYAKYVKMGMFEPWKHSFLLFYAYLIANPNGVLGSHPGEGWSLDRIDNNIGYFPGNLRWATRSMQQLNKGPTIQIQIICECGLVTHGGPMARHQNKTGHTSMEELDS